MTELPPEVRDAFAAARSGFDADPARLERVRARVLSQAGSAVAGSRGTVSPKLWLVVGAVGLMVLGYGAYVLRPMAPDDQGAEAAPATPTPAPLEAAAQPRAPEPVAAMSSPTATRALHVVEQPTEPRTSPVSVEPATPPPTETPSAPVVMAPQPRVTRQRAGVLRAAAPARAVSVVPTASTGDRVSAVEREAEPSELLLDEAALIEGARAALAAGDTHGAAVKLRTHALRHPAGQLLVERLALRTQLSCQLHDRKAARSDYAQLLLLRPPAALRTSMERTCGAWIAE